MAATAAVAATAPSTSTLNFTITNWRKSGSVFGPRIGSILFSRNQLSSEVQDGSNQSLQTRLETPTFITTTSRGLVQHLSRDNVKRSQSIRWVNVPFESFLEAIPPIPTTYPGPDPLHTFLGFKPGNHLVGMTARDPYDGRTMPPNGKEVVSVWTLRGVRKLSAAEWSNHALKAQPDVVFALSDIPFTDPPYSQKRLTKSIERSSQWLSTLLSSLPATFHPSVPSTVPTESSPSTPMPIILHLSGLTSAAARRAFSRSVLEPLSGPDLEPVKRLGIKTLDEGVAGYSVDLVPLRMALEAEERKAAPPNMTTSTSTTTSTTATVESVTSDSPTRAPGTETTTSLTSTTLQSTTTSTSTITQTTPIFNTKMHLALPPHTTTTISLIRSSLEALPPSKLRIVNGVESPHDILRYISEVGIDVFDAGWAQRCADVGVALDFEFPARSPDEQQGGSGRKLLGHNLYEDAYRIAFEPLSSFTSGLCRCPTCTLIHPSASEEIRHGVDSPEHAYPDSFSNADIHTTHSESSGYTRAYIHHLLHTHEMSGHSLLVMHNLEVLDRLFKGIRAILSRDSSSSEIGDSTSDGSPTSLWNDEVNRFIDVYDERGSFEMFEQAKVMWRDVDRKRGKGRLAREKEQEKTGAELGAEAGWDA